MTRRTWVAVVAAALALSIALPSVALAAKPYREVIDLGTPDAEREASEFVTEACGFSVEASFDSRMIMHVFFDQQGAFKREIDNYLSWLTFTNPATGTSVTLHDVGPDLVWFSKDGSLLIASIGRSLGGSGYIGRLVFNLDTGEVVFVAGRFVGSGYDQVCVPLAA